MRFVFVVSQHIKYFRDGHDLQSHEIVTSCVCVTDFHVTDQ